MNSKSDSGRFVIGDEKLTQTQKYIPEGSTEYQKVLYDLLASRLPDIKTQCCSCKYSDCEPDVWKRYEDANDVTSIKNIDLKFDDLSISKSKRNAKYFNDLSSNINNNKLKQNFKEILTDNNNNYSNFRIHSNKYSHCVNENANESKCGDKFYLPEDSLFTVGNTYSIYTAALSLENMGTTCSSGLDGKNQDFHDIRTKHHKSCSKAQGKRSKRIRQKLLQLNLEHSLEISHPRCTCGKHEHYNSGLPTIIVTDKEIQAQKEKSETVVPKSDSIEIVNRQHDFNDNKSVEYVCENRKDSPILNEGEDIQISPRRNSSSVASLAKSRSSLNSSQSSPKKSPYNQQSPTHIKSHSFDCDNTDSCSNNTRPRSQTWSHTSLTKPSLNEKQSSSLISSPILCPVGNHRSVLPPIRNGHKNEKNKTSSKNSLEVPLSESCPVHGNSSPINGKKVLNSKHLSVNGSIKSQGVYEEDDFEPVSRRRAVSESIHSHPRRVLQRSPDQSGGQPHVHWADEERGSSLSTSVFLTSIRPRSYSHGAVDGRPQRPILKKAVIVY